MFRLSNKNTKFWLPIVLCVALLIWPCLVNAMETVQMVDVSSKKLSLTSGKSVILRTTDAVKRISIADPKVADFVLISSKEIYLTGKSAGTTNLMLWNNGKVSGIYDLEVSYDLSTLKQQLHELLPAETGLKVLQGAEAITLAGTVSSAGQLAKALALAKTFAPEQKVNNLTEVGGGHQVMLEVRVAEMSKETTKRLGINFNYVSGNDYGLSLLGGLSQLVAATDANIGSPAPNDFWLNIPQSVQAVLRFETGSTTWSSFIDALQQDGLVKVLARPTLIAMSGQQASFLAGGEFPVPMPQGLGTVAIEYKTFGVALNFTPVVLSNERINIQVSPEVSELDFSTAVQYSGFVIPGLTSRKTSTTIELGDGQSFAIAGLLKDNVRDVLQKFPLLGDIPILGTLFRSRKFLRSETELVIIVTPRLVKPINIAETTLPTDFYAEPNDSQVYIEGVIQGRDVENKGAASTGLEGEFGHSMPDEG